VPIFSTSIGSERLRHSAIDRDISIRQILP